MGGDRNSQRLQRLRAPLLPRRVCDIRGQAFAFLPHRLLRDGFLSCLDAEELQLYVFLLLAANRAGVSFYGVDAICGVLNLPLDRYVRARNALIAKDLIAFDRTRYQVLSLPDRPAHTPSPRPLVSPEDVEERDPATIRAIIRQSLGLND